MKSFVKSLLVVVFCLGSNIASASDWKLLPVSVMTEEGEKLLVVQTDEFTKYVTKAPIEVSSFHNGLHLCKTAALNGPSRIIYLGDGSAYTQAKEYSFATAKWKKIK